MNILHINIRLYYELEDFVEREPQWPVRFAKLFIILWFMIKIDNKQE